MTDVRPPPIDALGWARLKDHLADLSAMEASEREAALELLPLDATDRQHLEQLLAPLQAGDARLLAPHPSTRAVADVAALRCGVGDIVGSYRIEGLLGRGGMGEVYEARALDGDQLVALKVLRLGLAQSDYARFSENEQRALRRLDDPRIAKFIEAFTLPEIGTCLVLEWVDGEQLQSYCRSRRFNVEARLKLFIEVCHAVSSAHQQLVVHRDLKPSNVLVTPDGHVKLLDFGVAKLLDEVSALTQTHGDLFTLDYAAPEQVLREAVATTTDVYALGVLLFRLLTDVSPYPLQDGGSLVKAVLNDPPQRLAEALDRSRTTGGAPPALQLDRDLDRVVQHAMEKDPRNRYRGAIDLAADVQAVLDGLPISGGGGATYRLRKFVRRHRTMVAAAAVVMLSLIAATGFSLQAAHRAQLQAHRADMVRDFLLNALRSPNPVQSSLPTRSLEGFLEQAVAALPSAFKDDPITEAQLLIQFGRTLERLDRSEAAVEAYTHADQLLAAADLLASDPMRIDARGFLIGAYRTRRQFPQALTIANQQAELCAAPSQLSTAACFRIVNDQIFALGFDSDPERALILVDQNLQRIDTGELDSDDQTAYVYALQAWLRHALGDTSGELESALTLAGRALALVKADHPGLPFALTYLATSAEDLADIGLARELSTYALHGYEVLYGVDAHPTTALRAQAATLALHAGDLAAARVLCHSLMQLPNEEIYASWIERATVLAALADDAGITDAQLLEVEQGRQDALGDGSLSLAELRLDLAAVALKRQQWARARQLLELTGVLMKERRSAALQPLYWQLMSDLASMSSMPDPLAASTASANVRALLKVQQRYLFDPVRAQWIGEPVIDVEQKVRRIRQIAERVYARRAAIQAHP